MTGRVGALQGIEGDRAQMCALCPAQALPQAMFGPAWPWEDVFPKSSSAQVLLQHSSVCLLPWAIPCLPQAVQVSLSVLSQLPLSPVGKSGSLSACLSLTLLSGQALC